MHAQPQPLCQAGVIARLTAPLSPRGAVDIVLLASGGGRVYIEGKVFDNQNRCKDTVVRGFGQTLE
jgi:hypothetical protein